MCVCSECASVWVSYCGGCVCWFWAVCEQIYVFCAYRRSMIRLPAAQIDTCPERERRNAGEIERSAHSQATKCLCVLHTFKIIKQYTYESHHIQFCTWCTLYTGAPRVIEWICVYGAVAERRVVCDAFKFFGWFVLRTFVAATAAALLFSRSSHDG